MTGTKQMPCLHAPRMQPSFAFPNTRNKKEYTVYKPKSMKERPFALNAMAPTRTISISSFVNSDMMWVENMAAKDPNITQNAVDQSMEVLIAACRRSNFLAP